MQEINTEIYRAMEALEHFNSQTKVPIGLQTVCITGVADMTVRVEDVPLMNWDCQDETLFVHPDIQYCKFAKKPTELFLIRGTPEAVYDCIQ